MVRWHGSGVVVAWALCGMAWAQAQQPVQALPEAPAPAHRWALTAGLSHTEAGSASAHEHNLALRHFAGWGSIALERIGLRRAGDSDQAWALDAYPRLWSGAYANVRYQRANQADFLPLTSWRAELYQNVGEGWELAASRDHLGFGAPVRIDGLSVGKYWGNFFARWRHQKVRSDTSTGQGDRFFVRYYYEGDADHYLEANVSRGRSDDFGSALLQSVRTDSRGLAWYHFVTPEWGFRLSASQSGNGGAGTAARDVGASLTRRW